MPKFEFQVPSTAVGGVVSIGNFDGVHRGHQTMLEDVRQIADAAGRPAVVVTFDPHPINVLKPDVQLPRLTDIATRVELLKTYGADEVLVLPVSPQLLEMTPQYFFDHVIVDRLHACGVVEGPDFHFGKDRRGTTDVLRRLCDAAGISLTVISAVTDDSEIVSSTRIRRLLSTGELDSALKLLGHPYRLSGVVSRGAGRGRKLGYPTANLEDIPVLIPQDGVYAGSCVVEGQICAVAVSIGPNPTFGDDARKVECHLLDWTGELYDQELIVNLLRRIRGLHSFDSPEQLVTQIQEDVEACRAALANAEA